MPKRIYLITGKPGSGKSTASRIAAETLGDAYHFSMGEELRARALHGKPSRNAAELRKYADGLSRSLPAPPHLAILTFEECVETSPFETILADGYPQYADRLPDFEASLKKLDAEVRAIIRLNVSDETTTKRLADRTARAGERTDETYVAKRLESYAKNVIPTMAALAERYPLVEISAEGTPEEVGKLLARAITLHS